MTIRPQDRKTIFVTGIFVAILLTIMMVSIFTLSKEHGLFSQKVFLKTKVKNAQNLKEGAAIQLKGIKVGSVHEVIISDIDTIIISLAIIKDHQKWIKQDSYIAFKTQGVLGDKFLEILGGSESSPVLQEDGYLRSSENSQFDNVINKGEDVLVVSSRVLQKIDNIMSAVRVDRLENILSNLEKATQNSNILLSEMNKIELGKLSKSLNKTTASIESITNKIDNGPGTLHALINDRTVYDDLRDLLGGAKRNKILRYFIRETIKNKDP